MGWAYVSGFFDGEGGITVVSRIGSNALSLKATVGQRSLGVLVQIREFLQASGIYSVIYESEHSANSLEVRRARDLIRFLRSLRTIVKRRQVETALEYLEGWISGNQLLRIYEHEYRKHKRKGNPRANLGLRFPMTRFQAVEAAAMKSSEARARGARKSFLGRMERRVLVLPPRFDVKDVQRIIGVSRPRAQKLGRLMEEQRLVRSHFEKVPPRFRKLVFERI
jgi:LAGLIDADG-like domain